MFIYLLCQSVANWAYLTIGASAAAAFSHVSYTREEIDPFSSPNTPCLALSTNPLLFAVFASSRLQGCNIQPWGRLWPVRHKNKRITFDDRDRLAIRLWRNYRAIGLLTACSRFYLLFFFSSRLRFSGRSRASLLSLLRRLTASGAKRCIASFRTVGHLIHFPRTGIARDDLCEFGQVPA